MRPRWKCRRCGDYIRKDDSVCAQCEYQMKKHPLLVRPMNDKGELVGEPLDINLLTKEKVK